MPEQGAGPSGRPGDRRQHEEGHREAEQEQEEMKLWSLSSTRNLLNLVCDVADVTELLSWVLFNFFRRKLPFQCDKICQHRNYTLEYWKDLSNDQKALP